MNTDKQYFGFVAIIGAPNAGKSTLLNQLAEQKISITCRKVQTTRAQIRAVITEDNRQAVFIDTPGIFRPKRHLERSMVNAAWNSIYDAERILLIVDALKGFKNQETQDILKRIEKDNLKIDIIINKVDTLNKVKLLPLAAAFQDHPCVDNIFMISASNGSGVHDLKKDILKRLPEGHFYYDPQDITDQSIPFLCAEITREHIFDQLHKEIPYNLTIETEKINKKKSGTKTPLDINQIIYVSSASHKTILLGHHGQKIKYIGQKAREEISELLGRPINLFLFVKHRDSWQSDPERYEKMGLEF